LSQKFKLLKGYFQESKMPGFFYKQSPYNPDSDWRTYFAQGIANMIGGLMQGQERKLQGQDIQNINQYQTNMGMAGQAAEASGLPDIPNWPGARPQLPIAKTDIGQQLITSLLMGQLQTPIQKAQAEKYRAEAKVADRGKLEKLIYRDAQGKMRIAKVRERELPMVVDQIIEQGGTIDTTKSTLSDERLRLYQEAKTNEKAARQSGNESEAVQWSEQAELSLYGKPMVEIALGQPASPSERQAIAETRASLDSLNNLKTLFDSAQTTTGPVAGRISPFSGLMGMTTDEQEAFMAATSAFKNSVIKEITGAQMSEVEAERIMKQIPDITDPPARWQAKWEQTKKNLEFLQKRRMEILQQSGLRVPMGATESQSQTEIPEDIQNMSDEELKRIVGIK